MEVHSGAPAKSPAQSPTPSMTPNPTPPGGHAVGAVTPPFRRLGPETLRAVEVPVYPKQTRFILEALDGEGYLPGQPRISLSATPPSDDPDPASELLKYLRNCHLTTTLDELMPFMKYIFVSLRMLAISLYEERPRSLTLLSRSKRPTTSTSTPCTTKPPTHARS